MMNVTTTTKALAALAQPTRLEVFRLLLQQGELGMPATKIAEKLDVKQNLMSAHLSVLANAGVTTTRRKGRNIYHAVSMENFHELLKFFLCDCCGGDETALKSVFTKMDTLPTVDSAAVQPIAAVAITPQNCDYGN